VNMSGVWMGEYRYDPASRAGPVSFTLRLRQSWFGRISGVVLDGPGGMPEEGQVVGKLRRRQLSFRKLMPISRVVAQGGTRPLKDLLTERGYHVSANPPHPPIIYDGLLSDDESSVCGVWRVEDYVVAFADGASAIQFSGYSGTWIAHRS
jgi:hypothetical protein